MGGTRVGPQAIGEYLVRMRERYEQAPRGEKGRLLDEVCEVTGVMSNNSIEASDRLDESYDECTAPMTCRPLGASRRAF